ncbi:hypothetical protein FGO68_gene16147 [Halteria grandinella]|uniref:Uncharacterized protein n=1 Tax=Halteria grandinella TaxID=5974 RepID=A0A8J8NFB6_HALGN|nr:hypothetical protein FGO68_gene16147 [Halteria grandinella]
MQLNDKLLSQDWLDFVNSHFKKERIQMRDTSRAYDDDAKIKLPKRFHLQGTTTLSANSLTFFQCKRDTERPKSVRFCEEEKEAGVGERVPLRSILKPNLASSMVSKQAKNPEETAGCKCKWKSALCSFQFDYEVFRFLECRGGVKHAHLTKPAKKVRYFVYLKITALLQKCQRHKRPAQEVHLLEDFERAYTLEGIPILPKLWRDFSSHLMPKMYPQLIGQPIKTIATPEDVKPGAGEAPPRKSIEDATEEDLCRIIMGYERQMQQEAEEAVQKEAALQRRLESLGLSGGKTKGKHIASLCQACAQGVCTYLTRISPDKEMKEVFQRITAYKSGPFARASVALKDQLR